MIVMVFRTDGNHRWNFRKEQPQLLLPCIAKRYHDLRSNHDSNSRTDKQCHSSDDVMQVARAFVPVPPSGPSSHDPCRYPHAEKNGCGIDRNDHEGHRTPRLGSCCGRPKLFASGTNPGRTKNKPRHKAKVTREAQIAWSCPHEPPNDRSPK